MEKHRHFIIHKPFGFISQFVNNKTRKKRLLGELHQFPEGTMAVGRLDAKSEGLLFLTTDGKLSDTICSSKVSKEYYVQLNGEITTEAVAELESGVEIGFEGKRYVTKPCSAKILLEAPEFSERSKKIRDDRHGKTSWVSITINEGKFRQVRKMTAAVGFPTLRLVRVRVGNVQLENMEIGAVEEVTEFKVF
ncbi:pseudouridine synthase [Flavicella sediminum]|uniref:pseudouridine synthase n=1 Tax=Flavicella sediminum TaxID=2585141 RepID=UPI00140B55F5|nr:pseudouridine synthase [Flavicella sediminum]